MLAGLPITRAAGSNASRDPCPSMHVYAAVELRLTFKTHLMLTFARSANHCMVLLYT
jgi:hypothetical protein